MKGLGLSLIWSEPRSSGHGSYRRANNESNNIIMDRPKPIQNRAKTKAKTKSKNKTPQLRGNATRATIARSMIPFFSSSSCDLHFGHAGAPAPINKSRRWLGAPDPRRSGPDPRVGSNLNSNSNSSAECQATMKRLFSPHIQTGGRTTEGRANVHTNVLQLSRQVKLQNF